MIRLKYWKIFKLEKLLSTTALKLVTNYLATVNSVSLTKALAIYSSKGINLKITYQGIKFKVVIVLFV